MNHWQQRVERAEALAGKRPEAAALLKFYAAIARFQGAPPCGMDALLELVRRAAPGPLLTPDSPVQEFCERVIQQAQAEEAAHSATIPAGVQPQCPFCGEKPVAAVLRPEGDGGKRFLLCSQCLSEWEFRRLLCPNCGEEDKEKLPIYTAEEFEHVRVEACDTCHVYLKAVDLTKDGNAVPEVDELATPALDVGGRARLH